MTGRSSPHVQLFALLKKRYLAAIRDKKMLAIHIILPLVFVSVAVGIRVGLSGTKEPQPPLIPFTLSADYYSAAGPLQPSLVIPYSGNSHSVHSVDKSAD